MKKDEEILQMQVSNYLKVKYPKVLFTFEASGLRLPIGLAVKAKKMRSCRGLPDLLIFKTTNKYAGLFIELKTNKLDVYNKSGLPKMDKHVSEQMAILERLNNEGYLASFAFGFDDAINLIDTYLDGE